MSNVSYVVLVQGHLFYWKVIVTPIGKYGYQGSHVTMVTKFETIFKLEVFIVSSS